MYRKGFKTSPDGALIQQVALDTASNYNGPYSAKSYILTGTGRLRTVPSVEQWSNSGFRYDDGGFLWLTVENIGGSIIHEPFEHSRKLRIGTTANQKISCQTRQRYAYYSGNSHILTLAFLSKLEPGRTSRVGYFDNNNGAFFEVNKSLSGQYNINLVRRSDATGTIQEERISQSEWNIDRLDGSKNYYNSSGVILDISKVQMTFIDFTWYGGGEILMGFKIDREYIPCHVFTAGNRLDKPILGNPNLPIRTEILDTSGVNSIGNSEVSIYGIHLGIDGSDPAERQGFPRTVSFSKSVTSNVESIILSIRPRLTYKGFSNYSWIRLKDVQISSTSNGIYKIIYNPTLVGSVWNNVDTNNSLIEYDSTSTSYSGGYALYTGVISSNKGSDKTIIPDFKDPLTVSSDTIENYPLTIVFKGDSNGVVTCALNWEEIY